LKKASVLSLPEHAPQHLNPENSVVGDFDFSFRARNRHEAAPKPRDLFSINDAPIAWSAAMRDDYPR